MKKNNQDQERLADQIARLEQIVEKLEDDEIDIEEAMAAFEEGVKLSRRCLDKLDLISKRVEQLVKTENGVERRPLDPEPEQ
ncbi:MAG: exodeoxyribonuclease VII small subunit [Candidatus Alcyoniella australis]|nr:exodeoxyribonuclease VII small subunit [Candidatus Alcyoniella australis]